MILNTVVETLPLIVRFVGPGPAIVSTLLLMTNGPLYNTILEDAGIENVIVSPFAAAAMAPRNEPTPLSHTFVTVHVAADADNAPARSIVAHHARRHDDRAHARRFRLRVNWLCEYEFMVISF